MRKFFYAVMMFSLFGGQVQAGEAAPMSPKKAKPPKMKTAAELDREHRAKNQKILDDRRAKIDPLLKRSKEGAARFKKRMEKRKKEPRKTPEQIIAEAEARAEAVKREHTKNVSDGFTPKA